VIILVIGLGRDWQSASSVKRLMEQGINFEGLGDINIQEQLVGLAIAVEGAADKDL
jgi:hypothetical protein